MYMYMLAFKFSWASKWNGSHILICSDVPQWWISRVHKSMEVSPGNVHTRLLGVNASLSCLLHLVKGYSRLRGDWSSSLHVQTLFRHSIAIEYILGFDIAIHFFEVAWHNVHVQSTYSVSHFIGKLLTVFLLFRGFKSKFKCSLTELQLNSMIG